MSIAVRIYLGMGAMIALTVLVGGFSSFQTNSLANTLVEYRTTAKTSLLAGELTEDLTVARIASLKFRQTKDPEYISELSEKVAKITRQSPNLMHALKAYDQQQGLGAIPELLTEYEAAMQQAYELQLKRDELVQKTETTGLKARKQLSEVMETALQDSDARASSFAGIAVSNLLSGHFYLERFLFSNNPADALRSTQEIEAARSGLNRLLEELQNPRRSELARATLADLNEFDSAATELSQIIQDRNAFYARMDEIGPQTLALMASALSTVVDRQNTLGPIAAAMAQRSILVVSAMVALGIAVGVLLALLTGRFLSNRFTMVTNDITQLADGNLDIIIEPSNDKHEFGQMNNAMAVLLENARTARDLDAEVKETESRERARLEAERTREAKLEQERRAIDEKERNAERERVATLEKFRQDMEQVLGEAASGNFAIRMSDKQADPSLAKLAEVTNQLLGATESNISDVVTSIGELANGNLGVRMEGDRQGAFLTMKDDFNAALSNLSQTMAKILQSGHSVSVTSSDLKMSYGDMSKRAEDNAATVEETSAAVEEITASIRQVVANAQAADQATQRVRQSADETRKVSTETETSINAMTDASAQINRVVKVIEDIAFQINLLALNAGVEAARAGEAGLGFSVVASEVRALALRSQEAVQEITQVIEQSNHSVEAGVEQVGLSRKALEGIIAEVEVASGQISEIALAVEEQAKGIEEVNTAIRAIDATAQKNAATLEQMTASSVSLSQEAEQLAGELNEFRGVSQTQVDAPEKPKFVHTTRDEPIAPRPKLAAISGGSSPIDEGWDEF